MILWPIIISSRLKRWRALMKWMLQQSVVLSLECQRFGISHALFSMKQNQCNFQAYYKKCGLKLNKELFLWQEEREKLARSETTAIRLSNIANMILFAAKVYASIRSDSLAILASTLDSLLDLLSGFILWFTAFSMQTPNPYQYPIGKKRMQPLVSYHTTIEKFLALFLQLYATKYSAELDFVVICTVCIAFNLIDFA